MHHHYSIMPYTAVVSSSQVQHEPGMQLRDKSVQDDSAHELAKDHLSGESAKSDQVPLINGNNPMITPIKGNIILLIYGHIQVYIISIIII